MMPYTVLLKFLGRRRPAERGGDLADLAVEGGCARGRAAQRHGPLGLGQRRQGPSYARSAWIVHAGRSIHAKETSTRAWIHLPGHAAQPRLPGVLLAPPAGPAGLPIPRELPRPPADFTGRSAPSVRQAGR